MRRFLAFITIAMLALAANAQQSPTNTDAVRSKLTMRGYKAFIRLINSEWEMVLPFS